MKILAEQPSKLAIRGVLRGMFERLTKKLFCSFGIASLNNTPLSDPLHFPIVGLITVWPWDSDPIRSVVQQRRC